MSSFLVLVRVGLCALLTVDVLAGDGASVEQVEERSPRVSFPPSSIFHLHRRARRAQMLSARISVPLSVAIIPHLSFTLPFLPVARALKAGPSLATLLTGQTASPPRPFEHRHGRFACSSKDRQAFPRAWQLGNRRAAGSAGQRRHASCQPFNHLACPCTVSACVSTNAVARGPGQPLAERAPFAGGPAWGSLKRVPRWVHDRGWAARACR